MVILGEIEFGRVENLGEDAAIALIAELLMINRLRGLSRLPLRLLKGVDAGAILSADIVALTHALRRVVALPEGLEQRLVGNLAWIVDHQHHLVVAGAAGADFLIGRIGSPPASVSDRGGVDAVASLT